MRAREGEQKIHFSIYYYHTFGENDESSKLPPLLSSSAKSLLNNHLSKSFSLKSVSSKFSSHRSTSTDGSFSFNRRVVFLQPTGHFLKTTGHFLKTTGRFLSTDGSFSLNRRVTFLKRQVVFSQSTGHFPSFHRFLRMIYHKKKTLQHTYDVAKI